MQFLFLNIPTLTIMLTDFGRILAFFIVGAVFTAGGLIASWLLRPNRPYQQKLSTYECGEEPIGESRIKFNVRFYVVALIFLVFEVEVIFLFPWAMVFKQFGMFAFLEMLFFLAILIVGYAYVWMKGDLEWDKPIPEFFAKAKKSIFEEQEETVTP